MSVTLESDLSILRDANALLLKHLGASKTARFWSLWQSNGGDYLKWRDELFSEETVATLYPKVAEFQKLHPQPEDQNTQN